MFVFGTTVTVVGGGAARGKDGMQRDDHVVPMGHASFGSNGTYNNNNNNNVSSEAKTKAKAARTGVGKKRGQSRNDIVDMQSGGMEEEIIKRLMEQEKALVQELNETRNRLQEQVQARIREAERTRDFASLEFFGALAPDVEPSQNVKQAIKDSSRTSTANRARVQGAMDVLPVLTSSGHSPFEIGLNTDESRDEQQSDVGHVLPIFQLPKVTSKRKLKNRLPKEPTDEEKKRLEEEAQDRAQLRESLGLTLEEAAFFDGICPPPPFHANDQDLEYCMDSGVVSKLPRLQQPGESRPSNAGTRLAVKAYASPRQSNNDDENSSKRKRRIERTQPPIERTEKLREDLTASIRTVQELTSAVHRDLAELHKICPVTDVRAQLYMKKWGLAKLETIFARMQFRKAKSAFSLWAAFVENAKREEKRQAYLKLKGMNKLNRFLWRMHHRKMSSAFHTWFTILQALKRAELVVFESRKACIIQKHYRAYRDKVRIEHLRKHLEREKMARSAAKLQAIQRGKLDRDRVKRMRELKRLNLAARKIQQRFRHRQARLRAARRREQRRLETQAALKVQCAWRKKQGKLALHMRRQAKRQAAAIRLQAASRQRKAKQVAVKRKAAHMRRKAAILIQRRYRGMVERRRAEERLKIVREQRAKEERMALRIQAIYRGRRGRLVYQLKMQAKRAEMHQENEAITKVQAMFRGRLGRKLGIQRKKDKTTEMIQWAREWHEQFDESTQSYVFINYYTQQVIPEPPAQGYTKTDGTLALIDGRLVEDPIIKQERERLANLVQCIECEQTAATRTCNDCQDVYCDDCYESVHAKGKFQTHTFDWFQEGSPQNNNAFGQDSQPVYGEFEQYYNQESDQYGYVDEEGGYSLEEVGYAEDPSGMLDNEWQEYFDEENGCPYYYNINTGETRWDNPSHDNIPTFTNENDFPENGDATTQIWEEYFDDQTSLPYWYNSATGESTFENPHNRNSASDNASKHENWEEYFDEETQAPYYYCPTTGETRWEL